MISLSWDKGAVQSLWWVLSDVWEREEEKRERREDRDEEQGESIEPERENIAVDWRCILSFAFLSFTKSPIFKPSPCVFFLSVQLFIFHSLSYLLSLQGRPCGFRDTAAISARVCLLCRDGKERVCMYVSVCGRVAPLLHICCIIHMVQSNKHLAEHVFKHSNLM